MVLLRDRSKQHSNQNCMIFDGPKQNGYGMIRKKVDGTAYRVYAHILVKMHELGSESLTENCSHLCHNCLCVNPKHLSVEAQSVNNSRQNCKSQRNWKNCTGHFDPVTKAELPNCMLQYTYGWH